jgi:hypothetical protein
MQNLIAYQKFPTAEDAERVAELLRAEGITCEIVKLQAKLAAVYIGTEYTEQYELQIPQESFVLGNKILYNDAAVDIGNIDTSHPLYPMTDDELKDIVSKPDEWGPENYSVALALLKSRGISISATQRAQLEEERISTLSERKPISGYVLLLGYACALMPFLLNGLHYYNSTKVIPVWYFPGFFGVLIGAVTVVSKTTLPDGRRISTFDNRTIRHGLAILGMNLLAWVINGLLLAFVVL